MADKRVCGALLAAGVVFCACENFVRFIQLRSTDSMRCVLWLLCAEQRSQAQNKAKALAILKAKLLVIAQEQRAAEIKEIRGDVVKAEWGQQIRSYVFHPYKLVKDVRTGEETTDVQGVMDGDLDPFMKSFLQWKVASIDSAIE